MSNFSTFFPAGGGGEGSGINSYAPFLVTSDNNPQGYIESTGVYTNPVDDSVWLKTGKLLPISLASTYPNATTGIYPDTTNAPVQFPRTRGFAANATHAYSTDFTSTQYITKYNLTGGSALVNTVVPLSLQNRTVILTSTRVYVYAYSTGSPNAYTIEAFDLDLVNIPSERITGMPYQGAGNAGSIIKVGTSWFVVASSYVIDEYDSTFQTLLNSYSITDLGNLGTSNTLISIAWDGTNFWITSNALNQAFQYTTSFVYTGISFEMTIIQSPSNLLRDIFYNAGNSELFALSQDTGNPFESYYQAYASQLGDLARTDSSGSGQPLFIKLK
tara:strand:- start:194 stop:1183 length:990 start_codon:yes stop_codon:yes gene_type:complete